MRILADENVHMDIVRGLRRAQHEVLFVPEVGLAGQKDVNILEYAEKHGLILLYQRRTAGHCPFGIRLSGSQAVNTRRMILLRLRQPPILGDRSTQ